MENHRHIVALILWPSFNARDHVIDAIQNWIQWLLDLIFVHFTWFSVSSNVKYSPKLPEFQPSSEHGIIAYCSPDEITEPKGQNSTRVRRASLYHSADRTSNVVQLPCYSNKRYWELRQLTSDWTSLTWQIIIINKIINFPERRPWDRHWEIKQHTSTETRQVSGLLGEWISGLQTRYK